MTLLLEGIMDAFAAMSYWELLAVGFGIAYILLAAKESLWTWFFAFFGTLIYTILFWHDALLSSAILNFYYMGMAFYGFYLWRGGTKKEELPISSWSVYLHGKIILAGLVLSLTGGYISDRYLGANFAYLDTFVMVFSVIATWMLAKKILENWLYWIVVDSVAIVLYWKSGYLATIVLFVLYVILAVYAYVSWRSSVAQHRSL
ncbi:MAG TPA: nicotinamide riboside transporter PnuC [Sulfurovum sp.]|jgi:nicotinamide mononucleotide transporter|nr:MAG: nicotinamide mononucleotide transporter [Sulfurovum sp. 35-42-20]OYZ25896.1 MAG: nicotinamide mononucleotide transporter [Sulfurovum sp. 16-42-52]OYZ48741.1 MAG: nicotinamide mononucleotide transporter [Sulfurovum sp. 24-42-9]OZA46785.1 MAG: nicotinamide mononucleotide transporter [Sulfurovum sp. 17-42-90]OZA60017.1 MAG: nicotinamide mononucleotide transporter [Sulfurovum sp. 39-42-12]HQR73497.1 nicotinamide riboside transporter PnuC [Sulfurovum sp.]